jgi:hypothetical protein
MIDQNILGWVLLGVIAVVFAIIFYLMRKIELKERRKK